MNFDGLALEPAYETPQHPTGLIPEEGEQIYGGNCHCGAVTYSLRSKPLTKDGPKVATCDCSICARVCFKPWLIGSYVREDWLISQERRVVGLSSQGRPHHSWRGRSDGLCFRRENCAQILQHLRRFTIQLAAAPED